MNIINIGVQSGGPKDGGLGSIKVDLYNSFNKYCSSTHCEAVEEYAPIFRVDGNISQFGNEEITRLRFSKKQRYITADIQVPETVWGPKRKNEIRDYIAIKVRETMLLFIARLKKENIKLNDTALLSEIDNAINHFVKINYEKKSFIRGRTKTTY
jgi:hypothetical protein